MWIPNFWNTLGRKSRISLIWNCKFYILLCFFNKILRFEGETGSCNPGVQVQALFMSVLKLRTSGLRIVLRGVRFLKLCLVFPPSFSRLRLRPFSPSTPSSSSVPGVRARRRWLRQQQQLPPRQPTPRPANKCTRSRSDRRLGFHLIFVYPRR